MRAAVFAAIVAFAGCRVRARTQLTLNGTEVRRVSREAALTLPRRSDRAPSEGDWLIRSRAMRITVAGTVNRRRNEPPGSVSQFRHPDHLSVESLRTMEFLLRVGQRDLALRDETIEVIESHGAPALRLHGWARAGDQPLEVERTYVPERGRGALHVTTRVTHRGRRRVASVRLGARLNWGGDAPFAPGAGTLDKDVDGRGAWMGLSREGLSVTVARLRGVLDYHAVGERPLNTTARETRSVQPETEVFDPAAPMEPNSTREDRLTVFVLEGDLSTAARAVMLARGEAVAEQSLRVIGAEAEAATVMIGRPDGSMVLMAGPTHDRVTVPLAPGRYLAWATAPGHAVGDPVALQVEPGATGVVPRELILPPGARIRVEARDAESEAPLPVRITVRGIPPTADPFLGPNSSAAGAGVVVLATEGRAEFPVAPGQYSVTVSHGPLWTLYAAEVRVTHSLRGDVRAPLRRALTLPGWVACDLHVHSARSFDSRVTVEDRVASLTSEDIRFATPTEHNVVGDYAPGIALLPEAWRPRMSWVPAVEVTTDRSAQPWGHFNVYPYRPDPETPNGAPPPFLNVSPRAIFRAARANTPDGFIQVNHPRMPTNIGYFDVTGLDPRTNRAVSPEYDPGYDAIEVFNGFYLGRVSHVEEVMRDWTQLLASGARYVATGSSDSHTVAYQWAGWPRTMVHLLPDDVPAEGTDPDAAPDPAAVMRALRRGRAMITSGPMLFVSTAAYEPGDTVEISGALEVPVRVRLVAAPWIRVEQVEVLRNGELVSTLPVPPSQETERLEAEVPVRVSPGDFVIARARGPAGDLERILPHSNGQPFAFTNPLWFSQGAPSPPPPPPDAGVAPTPPSGR